MNYDLADKAIMDMNRRNLRAFDGLKTLKFDELNVLRSVSKVYDDSYRIARRRYLKIAYEAYLEALIAAGIAREKADALADDDIDEDWVLDMLEDYDALALYRFDHEVERKKQRTAEAILAAQDKVAAVDKALKEWTVQVSQFADNSVMYATIDGYQKAGIKKVKWVSETDNRVCKTCRKLDGKIFQIDKVPPVPHFHCRCILEPVKQPERGRSLNET